MRTSSRLPRELAAISGIDLQMVKPEPSLVRNGGPSTVWQVVQEKVEFALPAFAPLLTRDIAFRKLSDWDQLCCVFCYATIQLLNLLDFR